MVGLVELDEVDSVKDEVDDVVTSTFALVVAIWVLPLALELEVVDTVELESVLRVLELEEVEILRLELEMVRIEEVVGDEEKAVRDEEKAMRDEEEAMRDEEKAVKDEEEAVGDEEELMRADADEVIAIAGLVLAKEDSTTGERRKVSDEDLYFETSETYHNWYLMLL